MGDPLWEEAEQRAVKVLVDEIPNRHEIEKHLDVADKNMKANPEGKPEIGKSL